MRLLRRNLITVIVTLAVIFVGVEWIAPVALSFYAAKKAPRVARVVPTDLKDQSVSESPGTMLSYFGYEFEIPWSDLDETQTTLYPKDKLEKHKADLRFRSGLRLVITALPPRVWVNDLAKDFNISPEDIESTFGPETMKSDYSFMKALYEFTPDNVNHWTAWQDAHNRDKLFLIIKSLAPPQAAETGIFNLQNHTYKGFQLGNPRVRPDRILVDLYSDENAAEMIFLQKDYRSAIGVTQPEINRIVRSLHRASQDTPAATQAANN